MNKDYNTHPRLRAEQIIASRAALATGDGVPLSLHASQQLVHELQVHQVELEMQNNELRTTQLQLDTARSRYFDLYDLAPVGYCTVNEAGIITETNLMLPTMLGQVRSRMLERPINRFILQSDQDVYYQCHKQLFASGLPQECALRLLRSNGETVWVQFNTTVSQDSDGALVQRLVLTDISARKRQDDALNAKNLELENAREAAVKANLAKSEFLSSMSHELRTPLNAILGFAQLMDQASPAPSASQKSSLNQILRAGWYLLDLISELLELGSIESGHMKLTPEPLLVSEVLAGCQTMIEPLAHARNIQTHFAELLTPYWVQADRTRLKQVLYNLLSNAIKYNRPGGSVDLICSLHGDAHLRLSVRDTGMGLTTEQLTELFQPYHRIDRETQTEQGAGIGLALGKRLLELMGGTIGAHSTPGVGSVFWIELPLASAPAGIAP